MIAMDAVAFGRQVLLEQNRPPAFKHALHRTQGLPFSHFWFSLASAERAKSKRTATAARKVNFISTR